MVTLGPYEIMNWFKSKKNPPSTLILKPSLDLSTLSKEELLAFLKRYRDMTALEICVILAELRLRDER